MNRGNFIKLSGVLGAILSTGYQLKALSSPQIYTPSFAHYKGFNLLAKFSGRGPGKKFDEEDFEIMAEWGFNFARIPMSY